MLPALRRGPGGGTGPWVSPVHATSTRWSQYVHLQGILSALSLGSEQGWKALRHPPVIPGYRFIAF